MAQMSRKIARAAVMQMIYEHISGGEGGEETLRMVYDELRADGEFNVRDDEPGEAERAFITRVLKGVLESMDELDEQIEAASREWTLERMPRIDLTILRLATWEILHADDVPGSVAINEAVELANHYSEPASGRFINGVLGTILRKKEAQA